MYPRKGLLHFAKKTFPGAKESSNQPGMPGCWASVIRAYCSLLHTLSPAHKKKRKRKTDRLGVVASDYTGLADKGTSHHTISVTTARHSKSKAIDYYWG